MRGKVGLNYLWAVTIEYVVLSYKTVDSSRLGVIYGLIAEETHLLGLLPVNGR